MLPVTSVIATGLYQVAVVGVMEWTRKMIHFPPDRAESVKPLKLAASSPSAARWIGRVKGSVLSLGAIIPPPTPRLMKTLAWAGVSQPMSPNGDAIVQTAPTG